MGHNVNASAGWFNGLHRPATCEFGCLTQIKSVFCVVFENGYFTTDVRGTEKLQSISSVQLKTSKGDLFGELGAFLSQVWLFWLEGFDTSSDL